MFTLKRNNSEVEKTDDKNIRNIVDNKENSTDAQRIISVIGMPSHNMRAIIFQLAAFFANNPSSPGMRALVHMLNNELPSSFKDDSSEYMEISKFTITSVDISFLDYDIILCDYLSDNSDLIVYVVEQCLDSVNYLKSFISKEITPKNDTPRAVKESVLYLNFLDGRFDERYFKEFQIPKELYNLPFNTIEYDEDDYLVSLNSEIDGKIYISKLTKARQLEIISILKDLYRCNSINANINEIRKNESKMSKINKRRII